MKLADKKIKLPEKSTMNLYQASSFSSGSLGGRKLAIYIIVGVLAVAFLGFGVIGRYVHLHNQKAQVEEINQQLDVVNSQLTDYDSIKSEYDRYSKGYMTDSEQKQERKSEIISAVNQSCGALADVGSISIVNNEATVEIIVSDLEDVAKVRKVLEENPMVSEVRVYTADRGETQNSSRVSASLLFNYGQVVDPEEGGQQ